MAPAAELSLYPAHSSSCGLNNCKAHELHNMDVAVVSPTKQPHTHTIILLHGRGSDAHTFASEFLETQDSADRYLQELFPRCRLIFPGAKPQLWKATGEMMNQWFDMKSTDNPHEQEVDQIADIATATEAIMDVIHHEAAEVGYENILLGGISQGCAIGVHALLRLNKQLGGFIGLASWFPAPEYAAKQDALSHEAKKTPILLEHSTDDETIKIEYGKELKDQLLKTAFNAVQWEEYEDGGHWVNEPSGFDDLVNFMKRHHFS